ncbi:kinase-like domain-containing protein [Aspergillus californicus]
MSISRVLYEPIESVERMEYYQEGGYHPVEIGDYFHDCYRVVHKLGHGTSSTIWLAWDGFSNRYVAVKICTAHSDAVEIDLMSQLAGSLKSSGIHTTMIPSILDRFNIQGPNGTHACLVTSPARMSLSEAKNGSWIGLFQINVARALAAQLVTVIQYIHSQGFVHGDLHGGNILLEPQSSFDKLFTKELHELYGEPELEPVNRLDGQTPPPGVPKHGVVPIWLGESSEKVTLPKSRIILIDFGQTFSPTREKRFKSHTPLLIRPPEARFEPTIPLTFSSDIWTLACTIWGIIAQRSLFEGFLTNEDDMTCQQIAALGPLPTEWWEKWEGRGKHFTDNGESNNRATSQYRSLEDVFELNIQKPRSQEGMTPLESSERDAFFAMLRPMLSFRPENRPSAKQVLESEWMVKWAIPDYEKIRSSRKS